MRVYHRNYKECINQVVVVVVVVVVPAWPSPSGAGLIRPGFFPGTRPGKAAAFLGARAAGNEAGVFGWSEATEDCTAG